MKRTKIDNTKSKDHKPQLNRSISNREERGVPRTKVDTSSFMHIAQVFVNRDNDIAQELTRRLNNRAARSVGVWRGHY